MKLTILKFFIIIFASWIVIPLPIELKSFSEVDLEEGSSEYLYQYSNSTFDSTKIPYIFIKLSNIEKINLKVFIAEREIHFTLPSNDVWIDIPIDNKITYTNITLKINTKERNLKILFMDSSKIHNLSIIKFFNLNFSTNILYNKPLPLYFNITVDINIYSSVKKEINYMIFDDKNILSYCKIEENKNCTYLGADNIQLMKDKIYRFKLNCYEDKKVYFFKNIKILYYIEEVFYKKNNTFSSYDFTENNYLILDIFYPYIYIYMDDNSGIFHENFKGALISENEFNTFIGNNFNKKITRFQDITNGKVSEIYNDCMKKYLLIKINNINDINYKRNKNKGFIIFFPHLYSRNYDEYLSLKINQGEDILLYISGYDNYLLLSSNKNMKILFPSQSQYYFNNKIILNNGESYIYINSSEKNTKLIGTNFDEKKYSYKFINDYDMETLLEQNNKYNFFIRKTSNIDQPGFYSYYFFDIKEKYYIYTKKYFGRINLYKYKKQLNLDIINKNIKYHKFMGIISYYDTEKYEIINNKLIILSGTQFFNYYLNYGSFFDLFIQKVNDVSYIDVNVGKNKYNRNIVQLLNKEKLYHIIFELNHLIKLDNNFLDSDITFINKNGTKYILNNKNKIIYLKGNNFMVLSNKISIIYFYEKIENYIDNSIIEFDKSKTGKNMKINIINRNVNDIKIAIAKDFGFKYYYPLIDFQNLEIITIPGKNSRLIYLENYYDLLDLDIYESENEKYYIYLFEVKKNNKLSLLNNENIEISVPSYFDSITKFSKYNFNLIPNNKVNLILKPSKKFEINYHFIKCSNDDIIFKLNAIDTSGNCTIKEKQINNQKYLSIKYEQGQTLLHNFDSKSKFLFLFDISYRDIQIKNNKDIYFYDDYYKIEKHGIKYLNINKRNILSIGFYPAIKKNLKEYYIIIARKNEINNLYTFSDPCYITNLILNITESEQICFKKVYHYGGALNFEDVDINKIKKDKNDEYIINIISYNINLFSHLVIYKPVIYKEKNKQKNSINLTYFGEINLIPEKDYFLFEHFTDNEIILYLYCSNNILIVQTHKNGDKKYYHYKQDEIIDIIFDKKGRYYLEFFYDEYSDFISSYVVWKLDKMIEEIDLNKKIYFGISINYAKDKSNREYLPYYKIHKLKKDKKVYFISENNDIESNSPFKICKNENDDCEINVFSYIFLKGNKYTIYICNLISNHYITYNKYSFFPILNNTIINNTQEGHYIIDSPKILHMEKNKEYNFINIILYTISSYFIHTLSSYSLLNDIKIYSFDLGKNSKYYFDTLILVPENNNKLNQFFITNKRFEDCNKINLLQGQNGLVEIDNIDINKYEFLYELKSYENYFESYTSTVDNLRFISYKNNNNIQNKKFVFNHFGEKFLFIDNNNSSSNIIVEKNIYEPKYLLFTILNDETIYYFNSLAESKNIYTNTRLNTDQILINDFINIYIDKFDKTYNLYIKKYYGKIQLYESKYVLNNLSNIYVITKPIKDLKERKNIFNRLMQINKNQLITGFLSSNSLLDIYLEEDNDNKDIYLSEFKNRKYLKKGIEYQFHFNLNHLIKLEPQFNEEVIVYNNNIKIILNKENQTGILIGCNFKIISNDNSMVYFYPKTEKFQKRIEQKKGDIIEILFNKDIYINYSIDFGFDGFEPPNLSNYYRGTLYIENLYDKLEIKLAPGEYLFIYYQALEEDLIKINYINNNIISSSYKFNFILLKNNNNTNDNKFIIPNINSKETLLRIYHCKPPYKINISYNSPHFIPKTEYSGKIITEKYFFKYDNGLYKFSYQSKNDFILSYSYIDSKDEYINKKWKKDRIVKNNNLTINYIKVLNNREININFNTNYKNSLTKYIIIITPEENNNTFENLKNICFLTELINQKEGNFTVEEIFDIGENDTIDIFLDITKIKSHKIKYIINIISEELRFDKFTMFYEPKYFYLSPNENVIRINKDFNIMKIILLCGIIFILTFILFYFMKSYIKINSKKRKRPFNENLGVELNDYNDFLKDK